MSSHVELWLVVIATVGVVIGLAVFLHFREDWQRAMLVKADLSFFRLLQLRRERAPVRDLLDSYIRTRHAHVDVTFDQYLNLYRSGGNPSRVSMALVTARASNLEFNFDHLADIELHKKDAFEYVHEEIEKRKSKNKVKTPSGYVYW